MAKKNYYGVRKGLVPGIYTTWDECKEQVSGFPGAEYKGFATLEEVKAYLKSAVPFAEHQTDEEILKKALTVYVDGSYLHEILTYAYACIILTDDGIEELSGKGNDEDYVGMRNVAGEILASENAIEYAIENGYRRVDIYYDYEGIEKWADNIWKANKPGTIRYKEYVRQKRELIDIYFHKVEAHTGNTYNEMADKLAKKELGIE